MLSVTNIYILGGKKAHITSLSHIFNSKKKGSGFELKV